MKQLREPTSRSAPLSGSLETTGDVKGFPAAQPQYEHFAARTGRWFTDRLAAWDPRQAPFRRDSFSDRLAAWDLRRVPRAEKGHDGHRGWNGGGRG